jgi:hypothetical protein
MASIDVVAARSWGVWAFRLALVSCDPLDESVLLVRVCFPQEASHLVVADADAFEQILHAAGLVGDIESLLDPMANLVRVAEAARADFIFDSSLTVSPS